MATPASIIHDLPEVTWTTRAHGQLVAPPYDVAGYHFSHSQAERRFPYIDGAAHDWTGLDAVQMRFTFYFLNTLQRDAFPGLWGKWRDALHDGAPGKLLHPLLGAVDAVVSDGDVKLEARTTAGVVVEVTFTRTLLDPESANPFESVNMGAAAVAEAVDTAMAAEGIDYPTGGVMTAADGTALPRYPDGSGATTTFAGLLSTIVGLVQASSMYAAGAVNRMLADLETVIGLAEALGHAAQPLVDLCRRLYGIGLDLAAKLGAARPTRFVSYPRAVTADEVADDTGNTIAEVLGLNLSACARPVITAGTPILVYRR